MAVEIRVPFTTLIAPGGKVLDQKLVEADTLELRRVFPANLPGPDYVGHKAHWASN